jgi:hypothetical protein
MLRASRSRRLAQNQGSGKRAWLDERQFNPVGGCQAHTFQGAAMRKGLIDDVGTRAQ